METKNEIVLSIEFINYGKNPGTRFTAASVRESVENAWESTDKFHFDFKGVETITEGFADECFGKLILKYEYDEIHKKIVFTNTSSFIRSKIQDAYIENSK